MSGPSSSTPSQEAGVSPTRPLAPNRLRHTPTARPNPRQSLRADFRKPPVDGPLSTSPHGLQTPIPRPQDNGERRYHVQQCSPQELYRGTEQAANYNFQALAEGSRRKQEEERTRQEILRLERRKFEMRMLQVSLSAGIPPSMIPLIFAGTISENKNIALQANIPDFQQSPTHVKSPPRRVIMHDRYLGPVDKQQQSRAQACPEPPIHPTPQTPSARSAPYDPVSNSVASEATLRRPYPDILRSECSSNTEHLYQQQSVDQTGKRKKVS